MPKSYLTGAQLAFHPNSGMDKNVTSLFALMYGEQVSAPFYKSAINLKQEKCLFEHAIKEQWLHCYLINFKQIDFIAIFFSEAMQM